MPIDGLELNVGSGGATLAVDTISGKEFQIIKLALGAEDALDVVLDSGQQVMADSLPTVLASDHSDIKITLDSEAVVLGAGTAAFGKLSANSGVDIGDVDVLSVGGTVTVDNGGTFAVQVDAALPTGANTIGDVTISGDALTSLQLADDVVATLGTTTYSEATTKGNVIGVVRNDAIGALAGTDNEIAPLQVNASGALYIQEGAALDVSGGTVTTTPAVTGGGTEAAAQRVTIANNSTGVLSIDDNGGALTVDWAGTAPPIGAGTEATALKVTIATDSTGLLSIDDNGGSLTVDSGAAFTVQEDGAALTALQLIDNPVSVLGTATYTEASSSGMLIGVVRNDSLATLADTDNEIAPLQVNASGALYIQEGAAMDVSAATLTVNAHAVTNAGTFATQATLQAGTAEFGKLAAGSASIGTLGANSGVDIGDVDVTSIAAGSNLIGNVGIGVRTSGGTITFYDADLDETKIEVTDNAAVNIYNIAAFNTTAVPLFLQLWDLDADSVTVGTTAPTNQYVIPGNADSDGAGFILPFPTPKTYTTGFTVACSTDSEGNNAPGAGACIVNIEYST